MPVWPGRSFAVVRNPGFQSSRAKGAADINIETGFEFQGSKFAYRMSAFSGR